MITKNGNHISLQGDLLDNKTRCGHYHTELDIIAIKFKCCQTYYPCYQCHSECHPANSHQLRRWNRQELDHEYVILCGECKSELKFDEYQILSCKYCGSRFNPGCKLHYDLYFDLR